jgi:hypothetical protein
MHMPIYHILKENRRVKDPILQKYFDILAVDYRFDLIDMGK